MKAMLVSVVALMIGGCVEAGSRGDGQAWTERTYRTGSNIPSKNSPAAQGVGVMNRDEVEAWRTQSPPSVPCNAHMGCGAPH